MTRDRQDAQTKLLFVVAVPRYEAPRGSVGLHNPAHVTDCRKRFYWVARMHGFAVGRLVCKVALWRWRFGLWLSEVEDDQAVTSHCM